MSFSLDVSKFAEKTGRDANAVKAAAALTIFSNIITETPVDTGRLRANWQASINSKKTGTLQSEDKEGSATISKMTGVVNQALGDGSVFFTNNLPYAARIEYDSWSKQKAPNGMVRISIAQFESAIKKAIQELPK
jgi:hypothetical protein